MEIHYEDMPVSAVAELAKVAAESDDEVCGLIDHDWNFWPVENVATNPAHSFFMSPKQQLSVINECGYERILGVYHSHPSGNSTPSKDDMAGWHPRMLWRYFVVTSSGVDEFVRGEDGRASKVKSWSV